MFPVTEPARDVIPDSPLSSAILRYSLRPSPTADAPGPHETRPFGLRFARSFQPARRRAVRYCHQWQVAVDNTGRPLIERAGTEEDQGKEWESKTYSDGDEGQEEDTWGWEEQLGGMVPGLKVILADDHGVHHVAEGGPRRVWRIIENAHALWNTLGHPGWDRFGLTVTEHHQRVWLNTPTSSHTWPLPSARHPTLCEIPL